MTANKTTPIIAMVMAMDKNQLIGNENGLPWKIPGELAYFKKVTMGKPVVMGRKTHESIGRPLPGRQNIVITRNETWSADGVDAVTSVEAALECAKQSGADEIMIIGGAAICEAAMPITSRLYLTVINKAYEGDTWLTSYTPEQWQEVSREDVAADGEIPAFSYLVLERC